jgi:hypothetical protein
MAKESFGKMNKTIYFGNHTSIAISLQTGRVFDPEFEDVREGAAVGKILRKTNQYTTGTGTLTDPENRCQTFWTYRPESKENRGLPQDADCISDIFILFCKEKNKLLSKTGHLLISKTDKQCKVFSIYYDDQGLAFLPEKVLKTITQQDFSMLDVQNAKLWDLVGYDENLNVLAIKWKLFGNWNLFNDWTYLLSNLEAPSVEMFVQDISEAHAFFNVFKLKNKFVRVNNYFRVEKVFDTDIITENNLQHLGWFPIENTTAFYRAKGQESVLLVQVQNGIHKTVIMNKTEFWADPVSASQRVNHGANCSVPD